MLQLKNRIITYLLIITLCGLVFSGCNNKDGAADNGGQVSDEAAADALENTDAQLQGMPDAGNANPAGDTALNNAGDNAGADAVDNGNTSDIPSTGNTGQQAIAERSPVEITRIEMQDPVSATATGSDIVNADDHNHEPVPNLFPVGECMVEVQGIYQVKLAKDLLKEINSRRKDYGIGQLKQNTSLLACADSRCKEQTYFIGHFRPDGSAFTSVAPEGYIQGECIAVEYRTVKDIMEAWFSGNRSRVQLMNPDFTQCGISIYDIDGTYYIAAEFGY